MKIIMFHIDKCPKNKKQAWATDCLCCIHYHGFTHKKHKTGKKFATKCNYDKYCIEYVIEHNGAL